MFYFTSGFGIKRPTRVDLQLKTSIMLINEFKISSCVLCLPLPVTACNLMIVSWDDMVCDNMALWWRSNQKGDYTSDTYRQY